mmetsp:Transcript_20103/g.55970  ORF Transcript_20103/g.55970 Transcript_20103/m.55970 type:complete len:200 (-) Transcript_20103:267-866(-)
MLSSNQRRLRFAPNSQQPCAWHHRRHGWHTTTLWRPALCSLNPLPPPSFWVPPTWQDRLWKADMPTTAMMIPSSNRIRNLPALALIWPAPHDLHSSDSSCRLHGITSTTSFWTAPCHRRRNHSHPPPESRSSSISSCRRPSSQSSSLGSSGSWRARVSMPSSSSWAMITPTPWLPTGSFGFQRPSSTLPSCRQSFVFCT